MSRPIDRLAGPADRRLAVRITPDALRQVRGGSPWVFDGSVSSVSHEGAPGDLAVVFDDRRRFAAIGLWDPTSPIRLRVLHHGAPTPIDDAFWEARIDAAVERRAVLAADPSTTAYRCVHGENDGLPALVVDRYAETLVVKIYSAAWLPHLRAVVDALDRRLAPERVVLRSGRTAAAAVARAGLRDGDAVTGPPLTGPVEFLERGLRFEADVERGQKTGHFLDQRDNRALVRGMAEGADVLDVFASTGGFAVSAAAGGAASVLLVDQSAPALDTARRNLAHNRAQASVRRAKVDTRVGDAFDVMAELAGADRRFDLVVVDPPSFASNAAAVDRALAAYGRLTRSAVGLVRPGGTVVQASCSSRVTADAFADAVHRAAAAAGVTIREVRRTGHPVDHPIGFDQGAYLKALYFVVDARSR